MRSFYFSSKAKFSLYSTLRPDGRRDVWLRVAAPGLPSYLVQVSHDVAMELSSKLMLTAEPWRQEVAA